MDKRCCRGMAVKCYGSADVGLEYTLSARDKKEEHRKTRNSGRLSGRAYHPNPIETFRLSELASLCTGTCSTHLLYSSSFLEDKQYAPVSQWCVWFLKYSVNYKVKKDCVT